MTVHKIYFLPSNSEENFKEAFFSAKHCHELYREYIYLLQPEKNLFENSSLGLTGLVSNRTGLLHCQHILASNSAFLYFQDFLK